MEIMASYHGKAIGAEAVAVLVVVSRISRETA